MVEKGKKDKTRREGQKTKKLTLKEKRRKKILKKSIEDPMMKIKKR
mgnify:CR=1 FL=1